MKNIELKVKELDDLKAQIKLQRSLTLFEKGEL